MIKTAIMIKNLLLSIVLLFAINLFVAAQAIYEKKTPREIKESLGEVVTESRNEILAPDKYELKISKTEDGGTATFIKFKESVQTPIKDFSKIIVSVHPNPTTGKIIVLVKNTISKNAQIEIYDLVGRPVLSKSWEGEAEIEIDLSSYYNGIYFVKCIIDSEIRVFKILKEN